MERNIIKKLLNNCKYDDIKSVEISLFISIFGVTITGLLLSIFSIDFISSILNTYFITGNSLLLTMLISKAEYYSKDVNDIKETYDEILRDYNKLNRELDLNNPYQIYRIFLNALYNGYLSKDKKYTYSETFVKDITPISGTNIFCGEGVCRHTSHLLDDILNNFGIESYPLPVFQSERNTQLNTRINRLEIVNTNDDACYANHQIVLCQKDNKSYFFDTTQRCIYNSNGNILLNNDSSIHEKISYLNILFEDLKNYKKIITISNLPNFTFQEEIEISQHLDDLFYNNLDLFDIFYYTHKEAYRDISHKLLLITKKNE